MIKKQIEYNTKYLYHYTKKENINKIIKDKSIKSIDEYTFFTGSLKDSINTFEDEMMSYKYYIDIDLKLKKRNYEAKEDYAIIKIPYVEDKKFYKFDFNNKKSIYDKSIIHKGCYDFNEYEIIQFPQKNNKFMSHLAAIATTVALLLPLNVLADSWLDSPNYDISWYDSNNSGYEINDAADLAGLAYLVNVDGVTFERKEISVKSDISLIDHEWEAIKEIFKGGICGIHRILLNNKNTKLFANNNNYGFTIANRYQAKIVSKTGEISDIYLISDDRIESLKEQLITSGLFSSRSILVYNKNIINDGTIQSNNIEENEKIYIYEGYLFIKQINGEYIGIECESGDSIEKIKKLISNKLNIDTKRLTLYLNDIELKEGKTAEDYNIQKNSILDLAVAGTIKTNKSTNGKTTITKEYAYEGEIIKIITTPNNDCYVKKIKILNEQNKDITSLVKYQNKQFIMPNYNIKVMVTYEIINPKTNDNITTYLILSTISLLGITIILTKKKINLMRD